MDSSSRREVGEGGRKERSNRALTEAAAAAIAEHCPNELGANIAPKIYSGPKCQARPMPKAKEKAWEKAPLSRRPAHSSGCWQRASAPVPVLFTAPEVVPSRCFSSRPIHQS